LLVIGEPGYRRLPRGCPGDPGPVRAARTLVPHPLPETGAEIEIDTEAA
jgi:hypothetical protein